MSEQAINGDGHLKPSVEVESDDEHTPLNRISHRRRSSYIEPKLIRLTGTSLESGDLEFDPAVETRLLVLYSGGTIGMKSYDGVYHPEPNYMVSQLRKLPMFHDPQYALIPNEDVNDPDAPLVMPLSPEGKRIIYCLYEYEPLLDSVNMTIRDYARIANDIKDNYDTFDGFVILHGTDTMAYTASALAFMLESLGKPVILTGSQIPIFETRSDGRDNFLGALIMAGHYNIPEVMIFFHNKLLRGCRSTKVDSAGFDAFASPNLLSLADLKVNIHVNWDSVFHPRGIERFRIHTNMSPNVGILRLFPHITPQTIDAFLQPPMAGVILQSYGAGNGPDAKKTLMHALKTAAERGVIIINITQCVKGIVTASYATGKSLLDAGIIPGSDMTAEAALMKISYALGKEEWSLEKKKKMMGVNLRGEMTVTHPASPGIMEFSLISKMAQMLQISSRDEITQLREAVFPSLMGTAARQGNIEALEQLQEAGAQFNFGDYDGRTVLHVACCEGHLDMIRFLLSSSTRPSVHVRDRYGHTPLDDAIRFNRHDVIKLLRETGAHLNLFPAKLGMMLCHTVVHEDVASMESWYLAGADINQGDYDKRSALHMAVSYRKKNMVRYLLSKGASTKQTDKFGRSPIQDASEMGAQDIKFMLESANNAFTEEDEENVDVCANKMQDVAISITEAT